VLLHLRWAHCLCHLVWHSNLLSDLREPLKKFSPCGSTFGLLGGGVWFGAISYFVKSSIIVIMLTFDGHIHIWIFSVYFIYICIGLWNLPIGRFDGWLLVTQKSSKCDSVCIYFYCCNESCPISNVHTYVYPHIDMTDIWQRREWVSVSTCRLWGYC